MITVLEVWRLKPAFQDQALELMQKMDDLLGPPAHKDPGWCGHARFFRSLTSGHEILMMYPWRSRELHERLIAQEEPLLESFFAEYCSVKREIHYYDELPVDVEQSYGHH
jgi:hypothetical protein